MKVFYTKRVLIIIVACMILLTACAGNRTAPAEADNTNKGKDSSQTPTTGEINNNIVSENTATADGESITDTKPGSESPSTTDSAGNKNTAPKVKALYLTGWTVGSKAKVDHFIELAKTTEINSYVIDIKDDDGLVSYESQVPEVKANGTWRNKYDVEKVLKAFQDNGVYVIGRLVVFKDPVYSVKRPDLAIKSVAGGLWKDNKKISWLNPYNKENWEYIVRIAKEAVEKGFNEIQFDYVRFPSDGKQVDMDFPGINKEKYEAINEFLAYAAVEIPSVPLSADVFGIILESPADTEGIGQYLEKVGKDIDYISPMVYPSHYAYGQIVNKVKFAAPDLEPYKVIYNTLVKGKERLSRVGEYKAKVRPYLQDFTASWLRPKTKYQEYEAEQVREQIKAVYDAGYEEWILWNASNNYHEEALMKE